MNEIVWSLGPCDDAVEAAGRFIDVSGAKD